MLLLFSSLCSALLCVYAATALPRSAAFFALFYSLDALHLLRCAAAWWGARRQRAVAVAPSTHAAGARRGGGSAPARSSAPAPLASLLPSELLLLCAGYSIYSAPLAFLRLNRLLHFQSVWTLLRRRAKSVTQGGFTVRFISVASFETPSPPTPKKMVPLHSCRKWCLYTAAFRPCPPTTRGWRLRGSPSYARLRMWPPASGRPSARAKAAVPKGAGQSFTVTTAGASTTPAVRCAPGAASHAAVAVHVIAFLCHAKLHTRALLEHEHNHGNGLRRRLRRERC